VAIRPAATIDPAPWISRLLQPKATTCIDESSGRTGGVVPTASVESLLHAATSSPATASHREEDQRFVSSATILADEVASYAGTRE
jgi:hypothetical protein